MPDSGRESLNDLQPQIRPHGLEGIVQQITMTRCSSLADCIGKLSVAVTVIDEADFQARRLLQSAYADLKNIAGA